MYFHKSSVLKKAFFTRLISCTLLFVLILTLIPVHCLAIETRTVKVGIFPLGNFHGFDENGNACGYEVDYLQKVNEYTHWKIEYIEADNWADAMEMLDQGTIDLLAPAQKTPEREANYLFSAFSVSTEMGSIQTLIERDDLLFDDYHSMASLSYGAMENSPLTTGFLDSYAVTAGFTPDLTYYPDMTTLYEALYAGEVDAIATNIMLANNRVKLLGRYSPAAVYYIARPDSTVIMSELDNAMTEITLSEPEFQSNLFATYFSSFSNTQLTYEESEYVANLPAIKVGCKGNLSPLSYTDAETGEFKGITKDILDQISEISGITFEYVELPETEITYDYLMSNGIYVLANVEYNDINNSLASLHLTSPYLYSEKVLVAKDELTFNSESQLTVALSGASQTLASVIAEKYPNFIAVSYASVAECFHNVLSGTVDASMQNRYVAESLMSDPAYSDLSVIPIQSLSDNLCLSIMEYPNDTSELCQHLNNGYLQSSLDKAIKQVTNDDINDIIIKNTSAARYRATFFDFLKQNIVLVVAIIAVFLIFIFFLLWKQRLEEVKAKELEIKNNDLRDAVLQAKKANSAKSQFLSRMSHEIRTPMNAIVGLTTIARSHKTDPSKVEDYLNKIESSSHLLLNIINDVLDMSAIESEKLKIANVEFDIKQILGNIATVYYPQCKDKGIELIMGTDLPCEMLIGDSLRLNQILMNLVSNAYKFTDKGGKIAINTKETARKDNKVYLQFSVSDSGCGMSKEMLDRLFKPFEQESATTAQKHGGSGLGMSITKNLVDMMHGAIKVESEKGKGTTFQVELPFALSENVSEENSDTLKDIRALIVDDDPDAIEYTSIILKRIGVKFDIADSGEKALHMVTNEYQTGSGYDICFIDWKMPEMDGLELTKELRKFFDKDTLIIIVSAFDLNEVEDEAASAGANMFLSKPIFQSTVFNLLMTLSGGKYANETANVTDYDFTGHRILLAEDTPINREIAVDLLDMVHMKVDCAENGIQAVEIFNASSPGYYDLILMDVQMPDMDGYEATKKIRSGTHPNAKTIPIFAMTANAFTEDVSASLSAGMNGHISKPIDTSILYRTLHKTIF